MKYFPYLVLAGMFFFNPVFLPAQAVYFNNRYNLFPFNNWDYSNTIFEIEDGYIIYGATGGSNNLYNMALLKMNNDGQIIWTKYMTNDSTSYAPGYSGALLKYSEDVYFGAGIARSYTSNWVHDRGLLIKYNSEFDTLWKNEYGETSAPFDTSYLFRNLTFALDGGIAMTGSWGEYSTGIMNAHAYLIKTDTSGNKLWEHVYTNLPGDVQGYSVISTTDGGYAIGAFQYYHVPPPNETGDPIVIKTDSLGNFEWVRHLGGELMDTHAMVANSTDGNILVISAYSDSVSGGDEWAKKIHLVKLTNDNQVIFDRMYNRKIYMLFTHTLHCNPDGTIICSGSTGTINSDYPFTVGWLFKTDSNGDSLWYREYQKVGRPNSFSSNVLYNVIPTSDNGYISCGYVYPVLPDTGTQDVWVVKVDSMGCESSDFCWVGVKELPVAPKIGELIIFPNPVEEVFTVQFQKVNDKCLIQFVDITGRKVEEVSTAPFSSTEVVNCSHWPPGIYFGQLISDGKVLAKGKVVVK
jgi:hypothetical protein